MGDSEAILEWIDKQVTSNAAVQQLVRLYEMQ